jgi:hypothetical protein
MVIGGQALLVYGEPRLTRDIDITLGIGVEGLNKIKSVAEKLKLKYLISDVEDFVQRTMVLPLHDEKSRIRVDFIFSFSPYERQAIKRANDIKFGKTIVRFAALEDVVIHKIIARRARDIEDVKSMLLKNPDYESEYIRRWLAEFDRSLKENFIETFNTLVKELRTDT